MGGEDQLSVDDTVEAPLVPRLTESDRIVIDRVLRELVTADNGITIQIDRDGIIKKWLVPTSCGGRVASVFRSRSGFMQLDEAIKSRADALQQQYYEMLMQAR